MENSDLESCHKFLSNVQFWGPISCPMATGLIKLYQIPGGRVDEDVVVGDVASQSEILGADYISTHKYLNLWSAHSLSIYTLKLDGGGG